MAFSVTLKPRTVPGATFTESVAFTCDASYPPGGYIVTASTFGFNVLKNVLFSTFTSVAGGAYQEVLVPTYNSDGVTLASVAIRLVVGTTGVEVATSANVATVSMQLVVEGL